MPGIEREYFNPRERKPLYNEAIEGRKDLRKLKATFQATRAERSL